MSTEYKSAAVCLTGDVTFTGYYGGNERGPCLQLTFKRPDEFYGKNSCDFSNEMGLWFLNMTKEQARELAVELFKFADDTLEVIAEV